VAQQHEEKVSPQTIGAILATLQVAALDVVAHHIDHLNMLALVNQFHRELPWLPLLESMIANQESALEVLVAVHDEILEVDEDRDLDSLERKYQRVLSDVCEALMVLCEVRERYA
jgi:hypothetical protein